jgi:hypothetical protein
MTIVSYVSNVVEAFRGKEQFIHGSKAISEYFANIESAIFGKKGIEHFADSSITDTTKRSDSMAATGFVFSMFFTIILFVLYAYGAASLSYCYNIQQGASSGTATLWAVLAFLFCGWYYPYYALLLHPVCGFATGKNKGLVGGRRY